MVDICIYIAAAVFVMKIAWNVLIAYVLVIRLYRDGEKSEVGISLAIIVELTALGAWLVLTLFSDTDQWMFRFGAVFGIGIGLISLSYIHFAGVGVLAGLIHQSRVRRHK